MNEEKKLKEELMAEYKSLSISGKRKELGREIAEMSIIIQKMLTDINPNTKIKPIESYENLYDSKLSEAEYLDGLYKDVFETNNLLLDYLEKIATIIYTNEKT